MTEKVTVVCWKWKPSTNYRSTYTTKHVNILKNMVKRNTTFEVDFVCITDDAAGLDDDVRTIPIWENPVPAYGGKSKPNCFRRLKAFSQEMVEVIGPKFVWIDLDAVIVDNIDDILADPAEFKIWKVDNEKMPCNGSLVSHVSGTRAFIWETFDPAKVHNIHSFRKSKGLVGSDQAWIAQKLSDDDEYFSMKDGVFSYRCHVEKGGPHTLPRGVKIVFFHGENKPWTPGIAEMQWIQDHYK